MKRVLCLYRVSTKGQVDQNTDDIPMQRRECLAFIDRMEDWVFFDERVEKGVSGYKVSAENRDAILDIRALAEKKKFDVLLVFMFDRLGRREDETPFLVEWFIDHGIEVWSTREGQQKIESRSDKLINYIRFWQAGGESEKTSIRVKAAHSQMTADGIWRGGKVPYGYRLVFKGRVGKKNRQLYDLEIDEAQGAIVREVFDLVVHEGYGTLRAANFLNEKYPNPEKVWTAQTVRSMIRNPMYTGRFHMNDTLSEPNEALRLISDETAQFAQYALSQRIPPQVYAAAAGGKRRHAGGCANQDQRLRCIAAVRSALLRALREEARRRLLHQAAKKRRVSPAHLSLLQRQRKGQAVRRAGGILSSENRICRARCGSPVLPQPFPNGG